MTVLVIGKPDSGKSALAENISLELSVEGKRIYLATMIPYGDEGKERVQKHRNLREGKGFVTVERARDLSFLPDEAGEIAGIKAPEATVLLECVANLCANVMFDEKTGQCKETDETVETVVTDDILALKTQVKNLVIVTNEFDTDGIDDTGTLRYIKVMSRINNNLKKYADRICDIC